MYAVVLQFCEMLFPVQLLQIMSMKIYFVKPLYFIYTCLFIAVSFEASAQEPYYFEKALIAGIPQTYGREAVYTDELAYQLYNKTLVKPVNGGEFGKDKQGYPIIWKEIKADTSHTLRSQNMQRRGLGGPAGPGIAPGNLRGGIGGTGGYMFLSYSSPKKQTAVLTITGNSAVFVNGNLHMGDTYNMGYMHIPVELKAGANEFYVRGSRVVARLDFPKTPVYLYTDDLTLPSILVNQDKDPLSGAITIANTTSTPIKGLVIKTELNGSHQELTVPELAPLSTRKVAFTFSPGKISTKGKYTCKINLIKQGKNIDEKSIEVEAVLPSESYSRTFTSAIDGSLQYYAVTPQSSVMTDSSALFLSVHGAGVEALGQARAYKPKTWGTLVAPTNRRPRGFNWEDWGRLDALEVLALAEKQFKHDPKKMYLTGHSMGGHGTWFLGATYPDKWAAIAPCAGYPTLKSYGSADGIIPDSSSNPNEQTLLRAGNQSDVIKLVKNYEPLGVYVHHGDSDKTVPVTYARQMRALLGNFHPDMNYHEQPGGSHWFGDESVDWKPLFDFFKWHNLKADSSVSNIHFKTASPGISSSFRWASVLQQTHALLYSEINLSRDLKSSTISGTTGNVQLLKFDLKDFTPGKVTISLDGKSPVFYTIKSAQESVVLGLKNGAWTITNPPSAQEKNPQRYGTFKDGFNHRMVFVYGTKGSAEENEWSFNKARYDAEAWYYRGNGAVDIIADKDYSTAKYADRGVVLFGNKETNSAWKKLLSDCPIQVDRNKITAGSKSWTGADLSTYFVWPIKTSKIASVAVVSGTGLKGLNAANANQYFAGASGFPDYMIYSLEILKSGARDIKAAGFFDMRWQLADSAK